MHCSVCYHLSLCSHQCWSFRAHFSPPTCWASVMPWFGPAPSSFSEWPLPGLIVFLYALVEQFWATWSYASNHGPLFLCEFQGNCSVMLMEFCFILGALLTLIPRLASSRQTGSWLPISRQMGSWFIIRVLLRASISHLMAHFSLIDFFFPRLVLLSIFLTLLVSVSPSPSICTFSKTRW